MAKLNAQKNDQSTPPPDEGDGPTDGVAIPTVKEVPAHRRCPLCRNGIGTAYATRKPKRYYRCKSDTEGGSGCGHTWVATLTEDALAQSE